MNAGGDPDTAELLDQVRRGDETAFNRLLARSRPRLKRMVAIRLDDRLAARIDPSDVVQEAMMIATQRFPKYLATPPMDFYPWLRQIAWNCLVDLHRRHIQADRRSVDREAPQGLSSASATQLVDHLLASGTSPLSGLLRNELRGRVRDILGRLSVNDREILLLRHLEQLSLAECAAVIGISETAATQRQLRALKRLRKLLEDAST